MKKTNSVLCRRSSAVLAAALAFVSACGKKKDAGRNEKLSQPAPAYDSALKETLAGKPAVLPLAAPNEVLPAWAQEAPHFFVRDGSRFASAVGHARIRNVALARAAAEDGARVDLMRLIHGGTPDGAVEGALPGAHTTDSFTSKKDGEVFVRLEVQTNG
jgi:hypothetical protein